MKEDDQEEHKKKQNIREWRVLWEGGKTLTSPENRKMKKPRRQIRKTIKEKDEINKEEKRSGDFLKRWVSSQTPGISKIGEKEQQTSQISEIKKKLGVKENEKDEFGDYKKNMEGRKKRRKIVSEMTELFERKKKPDKALRRNIVTHNDDENWIKFGSRLGCDKVHTSENRRSKTEGSPNDVDIEKDDLKQQKNSLSQPWDGRGDEPGTDGGFDRGQILRKKGDRGDLYRKAERDEKEDYNCHRSQPRPKWIKEVVENRIVGENSDPKGVLDGHRTIIGWRLETGTK